MWSDFNKRKGFILLFNFHINAQQSTDNFILNYLSEFECWESTSIQCLMKPTERLLSVFGKKMSHYEKRWKKGISHCICYSYLYTPYVSCIGWFSFLFLLFCTLLIFLRSYPKHIIILITIIINKIKSDFCSVLKTRPDWLVDPGLIRTITITSGWVKIRVLVKEGKKGGGETSCWSGWTCH